MTALTSFIYFYLTVDILCFYERSLIQFWLENGCLVPQLLCLVSCSEFLVEETNSFPFFGGLSLYVKYIS